MAGEARREAGGGAAWLAAALAVGALAVVFRCWRLASVPPGLYVDEVLTARNALAWRLDAHAGLLGSRPLLVAGWVETSNLYLAFASTVLALGGDGLLGTRLLSVLPSLAAVPLLYWLGREVGDRRSGLLAALLLACSHWASRSGRTGWDAVLMVTLQLGALACLATALRRGRVLPAAVAGGLLGLSLYSYVAARLAVLHAGSWLGWQAIATLHWRRLRGMTALRARSRRGGANGALPDDALGEDTLSGEALAEERCAVRTLATSGRDGARGALLALLACLATAGAVAVPLLLCAGSGSAFGSVRVAQLSVLARHGADLWATLGRNLVGHLLMFHLRGGAYARDALPGWPMLDPVSGVLLLAGFVAVARLRGWQRRLLVSWPLVMVLGGVLSSSGEGAPYPYRVLSLAPWACLVAALGGVALWDTARPRLARLPRRALATVALLTVVVVNGWALFVAGPADPATSRVYGTAATQLGLWLRDHGEGRPVVLLPGALRSPPLPAGYRYAAANRTSFFRDVDSVAAVQLASGLYHRRPWRALDPLRPAGDVDLLPALPARLGSPALLVLPPETLAAASSRFPVERRVELVAPSGTPVATVLFVRP